MILDNTLVGNVNRGNCRTLDLTSSLRPSKPDLIDHSSFDSDRYFQNPSLMNLKPKFLLI